MRVVWTIGLVTLLAAGCFGGTAPTPARSSPPLPHSDGGGDTHRQAVPLDKSTRRMLTGPSPIGMGEGRPQAGEGASPVTSYPHMVTELHDDARRSPWIRLAVIGKSHEGRALWLARVADPKGLVPARTTRLFVLFRQHGDEPAPTEAALALLRRIVAGTYRLPRGVTLYLVPMVNPDGAAAGTRENGAGADLNRDWGVFSQPETRAVTRAVGMVRPQIIVDAHNWDVGDPFNANCMEVSRDTDSFLARAAQAMQAEAVGALGDAGYAVTATTYGAGADHRLAHRWFARLGYIACLIETHSGSPGDVADFQRRQGVYAALIRTLARRYAGDQAALNALEGTSPASVREASLFPSPPALPLSGAREAVRRRRTLWPWAVFPYGLAVFVLFVSRGGGGGTARTPACAPATGTRSAGRLGMRQCQRSPCSRAPRPAPAACGRRR